MAPPFPPPKKLREQLRQSEAVLSDFRETRRETYETYCGRWYGGVRSRTKRPCNLLAQWHDALISLLADGEVDPEVEPRRAGLDIENIVLNLTLDRLYGEIDYSETRGRAISEAMLGPMAVLKYGLKAGLDAMKVGDRFVPLGAPYVSLIDLDDYALDPDCAHRRAARWEGHRYTMACYQAEEVFGADEGELPPELAEYVYTREEAAECIRSLPKVGERQNRDDDRLDSLWKESADKRWDTGEDIRLWDIALYMDDGSVWIVTLPGDKETGDKYLKIAPWTGPEPTPYEVLMFRWVNFNPIGLSASAKFMDLGEAADQVMNKVIRQAIRTKRVHPVQASLADEVEKMRKAADGEFPVIKGDISKIHSGVDMGGLTPDLNKALALFLGLGNQQAGNPQRLSGSAPEDGADTATENQIIQGNAMGQVRSMERRIARMDNRTARHLGWYITTDPLYQSPPLPYRTGGQMVELQYSAWTRKGEYLDYNWKFRHRPASVSDPAVQQKRFVEVYTGVLPAMAGLVQGGIIPPEQWLPTVRDIERRFDMDGLAERVGDPVAFKRAALMQQGVPPMGQGQPVGVTQVPQKRLPGGKAETGLGQRQAATAGAGGAY